MIILASPPPPAVSAHLALNQQLNKPAAATGIFIYPDLGEGRIYRRLLSLQSLVSCSSKENVLIAYFQLQS